MVWNYHDDDLPAASAPVKLSLAGLPANARVLVEHFRIDDDHSNAFAAWKRVGSPAAPTPEQYAQLEASGQLQPLRSPEWRTLKGSDLELEFSMPRQSVSLIRLSW